MSYNKNFGKLMFGEGRRAFKKKYRNDVATVKSEANSQRQDAIAQAEQQKAKIEQICKTAKERMKAEAERATKLLLSATTEEERADIVKQFKDAVQQISSKCQTDMTQVTSSNNMESVVQEEVSPTVEER